MPKRQASPPPCVFDYIDFRSYLNDHLAYVRETRPSFSFRQLVTDFGFRSRSHLIDIIKGRPLTRTYLPCYLQFCGLYGDTAEYFRALVDYGQAKKDDVRATSWATITRLSPNLTTVKLEDEAYQYFSKWYHPVMISILDLNRKQRDHRELAKMFRPEISAVQARHALQTLMRLGFIAWDEAKGEWTLLHKFFQCTDHGQALALKRFHAQMQELGMSAYQREFDRQTFSTLSLSVSMQTRREIVAMVDELRKQILQKAKTDNSPEVAVQVNFQVFDLSRRTAGGSRGTKEAGA